MIQVCNNLAQSPIQIGFAYFEASSIVDSDDALSPLLQEFCDKIESVRPLLEERRLAARDMLRNGKFKPTGRSKPANEYLLRTIADSGASGFPRINPIVDVANFISLTSQTPLSLWDIDRAGSSSFAFRFGLEDEEYVFNTSGQTISLEDLAIGCSVTEENPSGTPIVNPVKDSLATKTFQGSRRFGIAVYASQTVFSSAALTSLLSELTSLLNEMSSDSRERSVVVQPGSREFVDVGEGPKNPA